MHGDARLALPQGAVDVRREQGSSFWQVIVSEGATLAIGCSTDVHSEGNPSASEIVASQRVLHPPAVWSRPATTLLRRQQPKFLFAASLSAVVRRGSQAAAAALCSQAPTPTCGLSGTRPNKLRVGASAR